MPRRLIDLRDAKPLLDVASYARRGPGRRDHLSQDEIELIERTVRHTPEVMVKVLTCGGRDLKAVARHMAYLNRGGDVEIDTDDGQQLSGKGVEKGLLEDWDLDLDEHRRTADLKSRSRRTPPKLVHKLMFSMPPGTPPKKVLTAVKNFARQEFALKHRYALVLHTDEPHPHVHMVLKAVNEQGERLNIRKAVLRKWRHEFARHLRAQGVPANATERAVRGQPRKAEADSIYRAGQRGVSHQSWERAESVMREVRGSGLRVEPGKARLLETREDVERGWHGVSETLVRDGRTDLAARVREFAERMPPPATEKELLAVRLTARTRSPVRQDRPR
jgi:predicted transcriptional regulator